MTSTLNITRAVARQLIEILEPPDDAHPDVIAAINDLIEALDISQGDTPDEITINVTGTDMDLPE